MARPRSTFSDIRQSPRNQRLLRWLRRKPLPVRLVGETDDGEEIPCAINQTGSAQWPDVLGVIRKCVLVRAYDKADNVLRQIELDPDDPELRAEAEAEAALAGVGRNGSVPIISVDIPKLIDNLARNMREVATESARQNSGAFKEGFTAMVSVVNICLSLLVRVEQRLADVEDAAAQQLPAGPEGPMDRNALAMMALQKAMGGNAPNGANGHPINMGDIMKLLQTLQQQQGGDPDA